MNLLIKLVIVMLGLVALSCSSLVKKSEEGQKLFKSCGDFTEYEAKYCVYKGGDEASETLVYAHGFLDDSTTIEQSIFDEHTKSIDELIKAYGEKRPHILVISYGKSWLLTPEASPRSLKPKKATVQSFVEMVNRAIVLFKLPEKKLLLGSSMGGANALQLAFHAPDMWHKVAIASALIVYRDCDPWRTLCAYKGLTTMGVAELIKANYSRELFLNNRPEKLLATHRFPKLYITFGANDQFGFDKGGNEFIFEAARLGYDKTRQVQGDIHLKDHSYMNAEKVVNFFKEGE